jgi:carbon storage regulator CsrA
MLVLSRRPQERIVFPNLGIEVEVLNVSGNTVRVGVNAPRDVLVLRHEVAEKDAARAAEAAAKAPVARPTVATPAAVAKPEATASQPSLPPAAAVAASRKWMHQLRNHLNTAGLAMQVAQAQMASGEVSDADAKLQLAIAQLEALDAALANGPAANVVARHDDPLPAVADQRPASAVASEAIAGRETIAPGDSTAKPKARRTDSAAASVAKPTALVVEDDANESALLAAVLRLSGFRVDTASDGCHALDYLATHKRPDVVLLDMRMPRCDGPTTISAIRSNPQLSGLRVVAVSGSRSSEVGVSTGPQGVDRWFCKPVDPRRLVHELKHDLQGTTGAKL